MNKKVEKIMDQLMEYLLFEVKKRNLPNNEFRMQKLIFKIKMELGKDHELYPLLPFYWYLKGPYSDVATASYEKKLPQKMISNEILKDFPELEDISGNILDKRDYFINEIDKDIYKKYAPYKFMYAYKYKIYDVAKATDTVDFDVEKYIVTLTECEGNLPMTDEYFFDFDDAFGRLFTNLDLIQRAGNFEKYWYLLRNPITLTWKTFAKGIRVCFKDKFYNENVKLWDTEFKTSLNELNYELKKTKSLINFDDYPKNNYTKEEVKMLNCTIGTYLRGIYHEKK